MNMNNLLIALDGEIARLRHARALLTGTSETRKPGRPPSTSDVPKKKKRNLSPEGRARIAAAVKARWAKQKKVVK